MKEFVRLLVAAMFIATLTVNAFPWNKPGHMVTAAIAYQELKDNNPSDLAKVIELLEKHKNYAARISRTSPSWTSTISRRENRNFERGLVLFMYAARWADDARVTGEHRGKWHYINYPFKPDNQPASVRTFPPQSMNIETGFAQNMTILRDSSFSDDWRSRALTWIFHLAGDAHQPLHSASLYTQAYQNVGGDKGGNLFYVKFRGTRSTKGLHSVWDGAVIGSQRTRSLRNKATELRNKYKRADISDLSNMDFKDWIQESFVLAKEKAYLDGNLRGSTLSNRGRRLPVGYRDQMKITSEERVTAAGYRMADLLEGLF